MYNKILKIKIKLQINLYSLRDRLNIFALTKHMSCPQTHFVIIESLFKLLLNHNLHILKMAAKFQ